MQVRKQFRNAKYSVQNDSVFHAVTRALFHYKPLHGDDGGTPVLPVVSQGAALNPLSPPLPPKQMEVSVRCHLNTSRGGASASFACWEVRSCLSGSGSGLC